MEMMQSLLESVIKIAACWDIAIFGKKNSNFICLAEGMLGFDDFDGNTMTNAKFILFNCQNWDWFQQQQYRMKVMQCRFSHRFQN